MHGLNSALELTLFTFDIIKMNNITCFHENSLGEDWYIRRDTFLFGYLRHYENFVIGFIGVLYKGYDTWTHKKKKVIS